MAIEDEAQSLVATAAEIARLQKTEPEATILRRSSANLLMTGSAEGGWNESIDLFTLTLEVPIPTYASLESLDSIEERICNLVGQVARKYPGNRITQVVIAPLSAENPRVTKPATPLGETSDEAPAFWTPGYFRVFISHINAMKVHAHQLKSALSKYHIAAFVAHDDIEPTKEWEAEIEGALRTMDSLTAIIGPDFVESKWCDQEVGFAIGRGKLIVPLCVDALPHGFLGKYQAAKIKGLVPSQVAEALFQILIAHPQSSERMTDALVDRMATSISFSASRETMTLLERALRRLNSSQVTKLIQSIESNSQVGNTERVPERIRGLVSKIASDGTA
jgi:hypothetical protein